MPVLPTHPPCPWSFPAPRLRWMSGSAFPCPLPHAGAVRGRLEPRQSPGPAGTGAGGQREPHLSPAEPAPAGRNLTILIYQIDKILSLQLRGYVINCVLITAAATSSECSNLRRNRGRCFKFVCVNSGSANRAACAAPGGAGEGRSSPGCQPAWPWRPLEPPREAESSRKPCRNPGLAPRAAGLSPAPRTLREGFEGGFEEPLQTPGLRGSSSRGACAGCTGRGEFRLVSLAVHLPGFIAVGRQERLCQPVSPVSPLAPRPGWPHPAPAALSGVLKPLHPLLCSLRWLMWVSSWELPWTSQCGRVLPAEVPRRSGCLWVHLGLTNHLGFATFPAHLSGYQLLLPACNQSLVTGCAGLEWWAVTVDVGLDVVFHMWRCSMDFLALSRQGPLALRR